MIPDNLWELAYALTTSLVGHKVIVDKIHKGIVHGAFGGQLEMFFMVALEDKSIVYIDAFDKVRLELPPK